ncbi:hypothetical protein DFH07DRAFT_490952 [Mycena maculata]|uniref:Uncharacterized protein n=1 Tax=Mycena maculata TaxID=230809 RepID=A0AAD7J220_9AGAR|nr:hypothetical protein DFH07DRAFT_490952 [Mycena maculata]
MSTPHPPLLPRVVPSLLDVVAVLILLGDQPEYWGVFGLICIMLEGTARCMRRRRRFSAIVLTVWTPCILPLPPPHRIKPGAALEAGLVNGDPRSDPIFRRRILEHEQHIARTRVPSRVSTGRRGFSVRTVVGGCSSLASRRPRRDWAGVIRRHHGTTEDPAQRSGFEHPWNMLKTF